MSHVATMSVKPLTAEDYLAEARALCRRVPTVWFAVAPRFDPAKRTTVYVYRIYRRGMGQIAERATPAALVAYLRKQVPQ
jgi:hypothetical protein